MRIFTVFILTTTLVFGFTTTGAQAVDWEKAPLACLPDRAQQWSSESKKEPCYCPPQSYCPDFGNLKPEDINFHIEALYAPHPTLMGEYIPATTFDGKPYNQIPGFPASLISIDVRGDEIKAKFPGFDPNKAFHLTPAEAKAMIASIASEKSPAVGKGGGAPSKLDFVNARSVNVGDYTVDILILPKGDIDDWIADNFRMPVSYTAQCCEKPICPANLAPKEITINIEVVDETEEEVTSEIFNEETGETETVTTTVITYSEPRTETKRTLTCAASFTILREGCIMEGTEVMTSTGMTKIEDLKIGDEILMMGGKTTVKAVNKFTQEEDFVYGINGGKAFISIEHPILTKEGWKSIDPETTSMKSIEKKLKKLEVGDILVTDKGEVEVKSIDKHKLEPGTSVYNLAITDGDGFYANGFVVKDFNQVQIHY